MRRIKTSAGTTVLLNGDLIAIMEVLYHEVTATRDLDRSFEDMNKEIGLLILIRSTPPSIRRLVCVCASDTPETPCLHGVCSASPGERGAGDVQRRPGDVSIANRRHTRHQHLSGRRGRARTAGVSVEPMTAVGMARVHQMHVKVPQPREHS